MDLEPACLDPTSENSSSSCYLPLASPARLLSEPLGLDVPSLGEGFSSDAWASLSFEGMFANSTMFLVKFARGWWSDRMLDFPYKKCPSLCAEFRTTIKWCSLVSGSQLELGLGCKARKTTPSPSTLSLHLQCTRLHLRLTSTSCSD